MVAVEFVTFDPENEETYPSVCQTPEEVARRFGFRGGETLLFDAYGNYRGQVVKSVYDSRRKPHVRVDQDDMLGYVVEHGPQDMETLAEAFDIHIGTAKRKLDGLVYQDKLGVIRFTPDRTSVYYIPHQKP